MDHPSYHRPGNPYGDSHGAFGDNQVYFFFPGCYLLNMKLLLLFYSLNDSLFSYLALQFRFTLLCHAACEAPLVLPLGGYTYGEKCLFLVNDWHAGLVPV